jgi:RNA recognition motif-containing protein
LIVSDADLSHRTSCDIITDPKTSESLCYGFIEFDSQQACEEAYFKMDNVLIDDRRIHVDFSQSVAKLRHDMAQQGTLTVWIAISLDILRSLETVAKASRRVRPGAQKARSTAKP